MAPALYLASNIFCLCPGEFIHALIQKAGLEENIIYIENKVVQGILFGTVLSFFIWRKRWLYWLLGKTLLTIYGLSAGIFAGCIAVALAEILDTFPILFRRFYIKRGLFWMILSLAIGKTCGSLYYFLVR